MSLQAVLDAGPLVAALDRSDAHHDWVKEQLRGIRAPLLSCESVLSEVAFLLASEERAIVEIRRLLAQGIVRVAYSLADDGEPEKAFDLMHRYRNVPMSLADACLVRMSELHPRALVFTLDDDFTIYRRNGRQRIPVIAPEARKRKR